MNIDKSNHPQTLQINSIDTKPILTFILFGVGILFFCVVNPGTADPNTGGFVFVYFVFVPLIVLWCVFWGLIYIASRFKANVLTFDKDKNEFTILHGALRSKKKVVHQLSEIKSVVMVTDKRRKKKGECYVSLVMGEPHLGNDLYGNCLQIIPAIANEIEKQVKAKKIASFLGLVVEEETIEASPASTAIDQNQKNKVSP